MKVEVEKKKLVKAVAIPLLVGAIAALLTMNGMKAFEELAKPPLSPPGWLFPVVWTILYILMGVAYYLVNRSGGSEKAVDEANTIYALQLIANFIWPILFFGFHWYFLSFIWLVLLWFLILLTIHMFGKVSKKAAFLMIPYLLWVTFAGYLNLGIWWLN